MRLAPIDWIRFKTYCFPVSPMVTTTIREAVPITMPNAVSRKRTLLVRNESMAMLTISLKSIVLRAVSTNGVVMVLFYEIGGFIEKMQSRNFSCREQSGHGSIG